MRSILLQLERLRRHYEIAFRTYDQISLLDLSHSLRIWADLKPTLRHTVPAFEATTAFKSAIPAKKVVKLARQHRHIFAYMPGGVVTHASNGHLVSGLDTEGPQGQFSMGCSAKVNTDGSMELKNFSWVALVPEQPAIQALEAADVSRGNFSQWMGAEVARVGYLDSAGTLVRASISREQMIRRVANTLDGSHPSTGQQSGNLENSLDAPIQELLKFKMGGLPVPYFILLKVAQDLLEIAPKLIAKADSKGAA